MVTPWLVVGTKLEWTRGVQVCGLYTSLVAVEPQIMQTQLCRWGGLYIAGEIPCRSLLTQAVAFTWRRQNCGSLQRTGVDAQVGVDAMMKIWIGRQNTWHGTAIERSRAVHRR